MYIKNVDGKGRCVFATQEYKKGEIIEVCEYIFIPVDQIDLIKKTIINDYWFGINGKYGNGSYILLGNGSLYNHSFHPNMEVVADSDGRIGFVAIRDIARGDELCFSYGYRDKDKPYEGNLAIVHKNKLKD